MISEDLLGFTMSLHWNMFLLTVDWIAPSNWTEPEPALYWSFDTPETLIPMEGTEESNFALWYLER